MKKRWFSLLLALCMVLTLLPFGALAEDAVPSGKCGEHAFWDFKDGVLTITGNGEMSWEGTKPPWAQYRSSMKSVVIEQNVTNVGLAAFDPGTYDVNDPLVSVTLPPTLKTIGPGAFNCCTNLKTIDLPEGLETIGSQAFWLCSKLNTTIPDSVTSIGSEAFCHTKITAVTAKNLQKIGTEAFSGCDSLTKVTLPKTLIEFGPGAFDVCSALSSIEIDADNPNFCAVDGVVFTKDKSELVEVLSSRTGDYAVPSSVKVIRDYAFAHSKLSNVFVPDSVEKLGSIVFFGCSNLEELYFTDGIQEIGSQAVSYCEKLKLIYIPTVFLPGEEVDWACLTMGNFALEEIDVSPSNPLYCTVDGAVFSKDKTTLCCVTPGRISFTIPAGTTKIANRAFSECEKLESVNIPTSVTSIGGGAFYRCKSLLSVDIPSSVTEIKNGAFEECDSLTSVTVPGSVTNLGPVNYSKTDAAFGGWMFAFCDKLKEVTLESPLDYVTLGMFSGCSSLTTVHLPGTVYKVSSQAFDNCTSLSDVYFDGTRAEWRNVSIGEANAPLRDATIHYLDAALEPLPNPTSPAVTANGYHYERFENTRADVTRMVWEMAGRPAAEGYAADIFRDINSEQNVTQDQNTAIMWGLTNGISNGTSASTFAPMQHCTRAQIVTFLYRTLADSEPTGTIPYADVQADAYYAKPIIWQYQNQDKVYVGLAEGNKFLPNNDQGACLAIRWKDGEAKTAQIGYEHEYGSGVVTKAATETADGVRTFYCVHCGAAKTEAIPKLTPTTSPEPSAKPTTSPAPSAKPTTSPEPSAKPTASPAPTTAPTMQPEVKNPFTDVAKDQYYAEPVLWAVNHDPQITAGTSATTFSPSNPCTRGQIVTFLWRANGQPEPTITTNPFTDVKPSDYFYKAVLWAVEKETPAGTSKTTFSPNDTVTRAQTVTFLWRAEGKPAADTKNPFTDVPAGQYYTDAVLWAVKNNVTAGTSATTFSPNNPCTRAQIVTFLYRDLAKK